MTIAERRLATPVDADSMAGAPPPMRRARRPR